MGASREYAFPVSIHRIEDRLVRARVDGKPELSVATPPEFKGGVAGVWSPEDLLVASAASCYAVTLVAVAERRGVPLHGLEVDAVGRMAMHEGRLGFVAIELRVAVATDQAEIESARAAARRAEQGCFVSAALSIPVRVEIAVKAGGSDVGRAA